MTFRYCFNWQTIFAALLILSSPQSVIWAQQQTTHVTLAPHRTPTLSDTLDSWIEEAIVPSAENVSSSESVGAALLVTYEGRVVHAQGYGSSTEEGGSDQTAVTLATPFHMSSVSKQFTAMAALLLIQDEDMLLDSKIGELLDAPYFQDITVRHLLTHTSGIADYQPFLENLSPSPAALPNNRAIVDWYLANEPQFLFEPGTAFQYANGGYILLAHVVETISGQSFPAFSHQRIFQPLNMTNTRFISNTLPTELAPTEIQKNAVTRHKNHQDATAGHAKAVTSIADYHAWYRALQEQRLLDPNLMDQIFQPAVLKSGEAATIRWFDALGLGAQSYGFGWIVTQDEHERVALHIGGQTAFALHRLDDEYGIAFFSFSDVDRGALLHKIHNHVRTYAQTQP